MPCVSYNFDFLISVQSGPVAQFWPTQTGRSLGLEFSPRLRTTNAGSFPLHSALRMSILTYSPAQKREEESPQATRETSLKPRRIPAASFAIELHPTQAQETVPGVCQRREVGERPKRLCDLVTSGQGPRSWE